MPISPPVENLLDQPSTELMTLFGRMRSLTEEAGFSGTLPVVWQCSDESQKIKKSLFGYVYDCPVFNLGRVGALIDPTRLLSASHHGRDLVILGGSHLGATEQDGVGYVERVHGKVAPCCGMLHRLMNPYLVLYHRASTLVTLFHSTGGLKIEIPYKYLLRKDTEVHDHPHLHLHIDRLVEGDALNDASQGKVYRLHPDLVKRYQHALSAVTDQPVSIGKMLDPTTFYFTKRLDSANHDRTRIFDQAFKIFDVMQIGVRSQIGLHHGALGISNGRQVIVGCQRLTDLCRRHMQSSHSIRF